MPLTLRWTNASPLPVESDALRADVLAGRSPSEVRSLPARIGRERVLLGDLFHVERINDDDSVVLEGDLRQVRRIGAGMASGSLIIRGSAGPSLAAGMSGGSIVVDGTASHWAGAEMSGGTLHIRGSAGDFLGAAEPGSRRGMRDGMIMVEGSVGANAGLSMRRGLIALGGSSGDGLGRGMIAGTIVSLGPVGRLLASGMKRGTLVVIGPGRGFEPSPTFAPAGRFRIPFLAIYLKALREHGFSVPTGLEAQPFDRYNGDLLDGGQGEILALSDL